MTRERTAADPPILVLVGPTAAGKSAVAERLVDPLDAELVSADALQVYRGLDIGTAKPSPEARRRYRYHCLDLYEATDRCTAGAYARAAWQAIDAIHARGRLPILVGGSGFYIAAVVEGLDRVPASDPRWRGALEAVDRRRGAEALYTALRRLDPASAERIDAADRQRILRALEVILRTGRRIGELDREGVRRARHVAWLGVDRPREVLHQRIERRIARMLAAGWLEEVRGLMAGGVRRTDHALQAIGYRELAAVIAGQTGLAEVIPEIERATRRLAKRQRTWFRRWPQISWTEPTGVRDDGGRLERLAQRVRGLLDPHARAGVLPPGGAEATMDAP